MKLAPQVWPNTIDENIVFDFDKSEQADWTTFLTGLLKKRLSLLKEDGQNLKTKFLKFSDIDYVKQLMLLPRLIKGLYGSQESL